MGGVQAFPCTHVTRAAIVCAQTICMQQMLKVLKSGYQQFKQFEQFQHSALMVEMLTIRALVICAQSFLEQMLQMFQLQIHARIFPF